MDIIDRCWIIQSLFTNYLVGLDYFLGYHDCGLDSTSKINVTNQDSGFQRVAEYCIGLSVCD